MFTSNGVGIELYTAGQNSGTGDVASRLLQAGGDPGALRPFVGDDGRSRMTVNTFNPQTKKFEPRSMLINANASLHKEDWLKIDRKVIEAAKPEMRLFGDIRAAGLTFNIPEGMGKTVLESQTMGDVGPATLSMDPRSRSQADRIDFGLVGVPLVIAHKDFSLGIRDIMISRQNGTGLDLAQAGQSAERVAEVVEKLTTGEMSFKYSNYEVQGYTTYTNRITQEITDPTDVAWTGETLVNEVLSMIQKSCNAFYRGPWTLYVSQAWRQYLDRDYKLVDNGQVVSITLRERLMKIDGISAIKQADYLPNYDIVLVMMVEKVVRGVVAMELVTVQWESQGGTEINFKIMTIAVPQFRSDQYGRTGLVHGAVVP